MISKANRELVTLKILLGTGPGAVPDKEISSRIQVIAITVEKQLNKIPYATIRIADGSAADGDFDIGNSGEFALGKSIEIQLGYNAVDEAVFRGIIIANSHTIDSNRSTLLLTCKHESVKMTVSPRSRHFNDVTDKDVVEQILQENGITDLDIPSFGTVNEQLLQANVTDWDFMLSRIDSNGMACTIDGPKFKVIKPDPSAAAVLKLTYGEDIISFRSESDIRSQSTAVKAFSWDYANQSLLEVEGTSLDSASPGNINAATIADINNQQFEIKTSGKFSTEALQSLADAKKQKQALSKVKGKVSFMGTTEVKPGDWITLEGVGEQFAGKALVSAVAHDLRQGNWVTEASFGWEEDFFAEKFSNHSSNGSLGYFSKIQGLHIGVVTDIMDPMGEGRVKVRIPIVNSNDAGIFARVATMDAGKDRGTFFRPEIEDEVIVGFINDDPSHPVILGMVHSSAKNPPFEPEESNDKKGYVSRSEIKITIHDGDKSIIIETPGGRKLTMDDTAELIQIEDKFDNVITMNESGIVMDSPHHINLTAAKSINMTASEITLKAETKFSAEAGSSMKIKSDGTADFEGASVSIKGSLVKIN